MSKFKQLNDKDWLNREYIINERSMKNISEELKCNNNTVRQALIKHGFKIRGCSDAQTVGNKTKLKIDTNILDGSLMGDAYLMKYNKTSNKSIPKLLKKNKYLDHLKWFASNFETEFNIQQVEHFLKATQKTYTYYQYRTLADKQLISYWNRWYPEWNNYNKVIPDDVNPDEKFLLHWFLDDGCSHRRNRKKELGKKGWSQNKEQIILTFASECFTLDDQQKLCEKINNKFNLGIHPRLIKWGNKQAQKEGYRCFIPQKNSNIFFEIIGKCPVKSLEYKWKLKL